jgi:hypothetical protein
MPRTNTWDWSLSRGVMKRKLPRHCRELLRAARSVEAQEQLRLWSEELDEPTNAWDRTLANRKGSRQLATVGDTQEIL